MPVLRDVSFTIPAGKTFAILGSTSSGKSTLMYLLNRLYDIPEGCGRITIGGVDVRDIRGDYLRGNIGMCLQEPFLFSRTIGQNIGITKTNMPMEEIRRAASIACVDEAITELCRGFDIPCPLWLNKHAHEFEAFRHTAFLPEHFMEEVPFQKMEIEYLADTGKKRRSDDPRNQFDGF